MCAPQPGGPAAPDPGTQREQCHANTQGPGPRVPQCPAVARPPPASSAWVLAVPCHLQPQAQLLQRAAHLVGEDVHSLTFLEGHHHVGRPLGRLRHDLRHVEHLRDLLQDLLQDGLHLEVSPRQARHCLCPPAPAQRPRQRACPGGSQGGFREPGAAELPKGQGHGGAAACLTRGGNLRQRALNVLVLLSRPWDHTPGSCRAS